MENNLMQLVDVCEKENQTYFKTDENLERASYLEELGFTRLSSEILKEVERKDKLSRITDYGYLKITKDNIQKFLDKKAELYNAEHGGEANSKQDRFIAGGSIQHMGGGLITMHRDMGNTYEEIVLADGRRRIVRGRDYSPLLASYNMLSEALGNDYSFPDTLSAKTCDYYNTKEGAIGQYKWEEERIESYKAIPPPEALDKLREHRDRNIFDYFTIASVKGIPDPLLLGRLNGSEDRYFIAQWGNDIALEDVL